MDSKLHVDAGRMQKIYAKFQSENTIERDRLEDLDVGGKIILELT
jgi:hypothetical protein